ncbi:MAG: hypothetical protein OEY11_00775 [Gammaproteobacteria bacterium]|nr:hypothetical protein [Gammaproteobacteria bacterium]
MKPRIYHVISVEKTEAPSGMEEGDWHRYTIGQGTSKIDGIRSGSLKDVTQHAEAFAKELNERAINGGSTYAPRKKA